MGRSTPGVPLARIRKFLGPEKNHHTYRISGLFGKFSFELCPRGDGFRGEILA
jgi:hypothetical protein